MGILLKLSFLFCIGCSAGWVLELFFRRFFSKENPERKWINPGFLSGPWLPLYGFGLCLLYLLAGLEPHIKGSGWIKKAFLFLVMAICMTAIEYLAGIFSIKVLKVHLWDYSNEWGNIQGIICPLFSLFWAILGAIYYFLIHPNILLALDWLSKNLTFSFAIGFYFGIFAIDVAYSCRLLSKIRKFAKENDIVVKYGKFRHILANALEERHRRKRFFLPHKTELPISDHLKSYLEWLKENANIVKGTIKENSRNR
ncbi:MAG: putative ABC transporter permease [Clostridia bacterium]|nr:putative ABC transporter permease [Clostridia bacterium]